MMGVFRFIILLSVISTGMSALAQAAVEKPDNQTADYILCRNQKTVRTIRVEKDQNNNECFTTYTKAGVDREVGRGQYYGSCVKVMENIRNNLDKAGWKCKEIEDVSVTTVRNE